MKTKTPHPHLELITEFFSDTSRQIEIDNSVRWFPVAIEKVIHDIKGHCRFRLADVEESHL
jgi:hypothetical protein